MSRKVIEMCIDEAWETRVESSYTKSCIRVNMNNKEFILMEIDAECGIANCDGTKCNRDKTTIAKIRKVRNKDSQVEKQIILLSRTKEIQF